MELGAHCPNDVQSLSTLIRALNLDSLVAKDTSILLTQANPICN